jgi:hypothetical protein
MNLDSKHCQGLRDILFDFSFGKDTSISSKIPVSEINCILTNPNFIEKSLFHVVRNGVYENYERSNEHMNEIRRVNEALATGHTVIIKGLEMWGGPITDACNFLGPQTSAHMYLSPPEGTGFPFHKDDTDVYVAMLYGQKVFEFEEHSAASYLMNPGSIIFINKDLAHRAKSINWSCHISFGVPRTYLKDDLPSYPVNISALSNLQ